MGRHRWTKWSWFGLMILIVSLLSCEELLPPRIFPDPGEALETSFAGIDGVVSFDRGDTVSQSGAGSFVIQMKNVHDEFLSGKEGIDVRLEMWRPDVPGAVYEITGDRNNLVNQYDDQGEAFLLDGDILSLAPDSSAQFLLGWDHVAYKFYEDANPRYEISQCPTYPLCDALVVSEPIAVKAKGTIIMFEQQRVPQLVEETELSIFYVFFTGNLLLLVDSLAARVDSVSSSVDLSWTVYWQDDSPPLEIQRAFGTSGEYAHLDWVQVMDTLHGYHYRDQAPLPGINAYRLGVWVLPPLFTKPIPGAYYDFPLVAVP